MADRCGWSWAQGRLVAFAGRREAMRSLAAAALAGLAATGPSPGSSAAKRKKKKKKGKGASARAEVWTALFNDINNQPNFSPSGPTIGQIHLVDLSHFSAAKVLVWRVFLNDPPGNPRVRVDYILSSDIGGGGSWKPLTEEIVLTGPGGQARQTGYAPIPEEARSLVFVRARGFTDSGTTSVNVEYISLMVRAG